MPSSQDCKVHNTDHHVAYLGYKVYSDEQILDHNFNLLSCRSSKYTSMSLQVHNHVVFARICSSSKFLASLRIPRFHSSYN